MTTFHKSMKEVKSEGIDIHSPTCQFHSINVRKFRESRELTTPRLWELILSVKEQEASHSMDSDNVIDLFVY